MVSKLDEYFSLNQAALNLRAQRQQIIASNIANADTPNYKARDIDFSNALQAALQGANPARLPGHPGDDHIPGGGSGGAVVSLRGGWPRRP